jgi:hypothetical protein
MEIHNVSRPESPDPTIRIPTPVLPERIVDRPLRQVFPHPDYSGETNCCLTTAWLALMEICAFGILWVVVNQQTSMPIDNFPSRDIDLIHPGHGVETLVKCIPLIAGIATTILCYVASRNDSISDAVCCDRQQQPYLPV